MGVKEDLSFAKLVSSGDPEACKIFVNRYSNLVLKKILHLMKFPYCDKPDKYEVCVLITLKKQRKGSIPPLSIDRDANLYQCDDCMDSYIWIFEYLKRKLKSYKGITKKADKDCSLNNYVMKILRIKKSEEPNQDVGPSDDDFMYKEWLRWKYGRIDNREERLPRVIRKMDKIYKEVFVYLRKRKTKKEISYLLGISQTRSDEIIDKIEHELKKAGLDHLIHAPISISLDSQDDDTDDTEVQVIENTEGILIIKDIINKLQKNEALILRLRFWDDLSAKDIAEYLKEINLEIIPRKSVESINEQDIYYFLNKVVFKKIIKILQERYKGKSSEHENDLEFFHSIFNL